MHETQPSKVRENRMRTSELVYKLYGLTPEEIAIVENE